MLIFGFLVNSVFGSAITVGDEINCPGRCWDYDSTTLKCTPQTDKIKLDCTANGRVKYSFDGCLFTPSEATYGVSGLEYRVNHPGKETVSMCSKDIVDSNTVVEYDLKFSEAEECGWKWTSDNDNLIFSGIVAPSNATNRIKVGSFEAIISKLADDTPLTCSYSKKFSMEISDIENKESDATQVDGPTGSGDMKSSFTIALHNQNSALNETSFTVGEPIKAVIKYGFANGGYTQTSSPVTFFPNKCYIENALDSRQRVNLIGTITEDQCMRSSTPLNLNIENVLYGGPPYYSENSEFVLTFDAFKFTTDAKLKFICDLEICLKTNCGNARTTTPTICT